MHEVAEWAKACNHIPVAAISQLFGINLKFVLRLNLQSVHIIAVCITTTGEQIFCKRDSVMVALFCKQCSIALQSISRALNHEPFLHLSS